MENLSEEKRANAHPQPPPQQRQQLNQPQQQQGALLSHEPCLLNDGARFVAELFDGPGATVSSGRQISAAFPLGPEGEPTAPLRRPEVQSAQLVPPRDAQQEAWVILQLYRFTLFGRVVRRRISYS